MLIDQKKVSVEASGMRETAQFRAKLDGMMFDNLINGIYSNKIGAGIREYATNARDGHARRGNLDRPFEVGLPNRDKAYFEVRDFGSSLTHEEVFDIFAVLGESTKRDTNEETGCLGLGSKSAFAYTNAFAVTCWKDGYKRDYSCYIGDGGQPMVSLISEIKSKEEQGVRVSYAVRQQDIEDFNKEASHQLRGFDPQPIIVRKTGSYQGLDKEDLLLEGIDWKIYKSRTEKYRYDPNPGKPAAIQGSVAYPIDPNNATLSTAVRNHCGSKANTVSKLLRATDILIRFPIGELKMTTSREELSYDEKTCENIAKRCLIVLDNIQKVLDEEYASCTSLKEARILRAKAKDSKLYVIESTLGINTRFWKGEEILSTMYFGSEDGKLGATKKDWVHSYNVKNEFVDPVKGDMRLIGEYNYRNKFGEIKAQFQWPERSNGNARWQDSVEAHKVGDLVFLVEIESEIKDKNKNSLMRRFWKDTLGKMSKKTSEFIWIKVKSETDANKFFEQIYHENRSNQVFLHKLSELKMPTKAKSTSGSTSPNAASTTERKMRIIKAKRYTYNGERAEYSIVDTNKLTEKLPVFFFKDNMFYLNEQDYNSGSTRRYSYSEICSMMDSWDSTSIIYVINGQQTKFYKDNKQHFRDGMEYLKENWKKKTTDWERKYAETTYKDDNQENFEYGRKFRKIAMDNGIEFKSLEAPLKRDEDKLKAMSTAYRANFQNQLPELWRTYLKDDLDAAVKKYPQPVQTNEYLKVATRDPVMKYLMSEVSHYGIDQPLANAILHYKRSINE